MKQLTDEEIQQLLEEGAGIERSEDVDLYDKVFGELAKPPDPIVVDITGKVVEKIYYQTERKAGFKMRLAIAVAVLSGLFVFLFAAMQVNPEFPGRLADGIIRHKWIVLFLVLILPAASVISRKTRA